MYQNLEARLHDVFWNAESNADESQLLEVFLNDYSGKSLEIGCGSGRLLLPLIEKGYDIEGLEISQDMLALLDHTAKANNVSPKIYHSDLNTFETRTKYNAITIPAFTFQLFSRENAVKTLIKLRSLVNLDGGLYVTLFIPWSEITDQIEESIWYQDKKVKLANGNTAKCMTRYEINRLSQILYRDHHYSIHNSKNVLVEDQYTQQKIQWYNLPEIIYLFSQSGWKYLDYDANFELGSKDSNASLLTVYAAAY